LADAAGGGEILAAGRFIVPATKRRLNAKEPKMTNNRKSSAISILVAWIVVGLPAGWGVYNTVKNSMKLFQKPAITLPASAGQK
jgi:hypothetical protein